MGPDVATENFIWIERVYSNLRNWPILPRTEWKGALLLERMEVGQNFKIFTLRCPGWQVQASQLSSVVEQAGVYTCGGQRGGGKTWNRANIR